MSESGEVYRMALLTFLKGLAVEWMLAVPAPDGVLSIATGLCELMRLGLLTARIKGYSSSILGSTVILDF